MESCTEREKPYPNCRQRLVEASGKGKAKMSLKISVAAFIMATAFIGLAFGVNGHPRKGVQPSAKQIADEWAENNYLIALDKLLPKGDGTTEKSPSNVKWSVVVRILPSYEQPEYRFLIERKYDDSVALSVTKAHSNSILSQLKILKARYPKASLKTICEFVLLERKNFKSLTSPQLVRLAEQFEVINISPVLPDELRVDATRYEFWSESLWGNRLSAMLSGPGSGAKKQPHPLLEWAEDTRRAIENLERESETLRLRS